MSRFYSIQIADIHLTSTGAAGGTGCKLEVSNVEDLLMPIAGNVVMAANGTPVFQTVPWTAGKQFDVRVEVLNEAQWEDLKTLFIDALEAEFPNDRFTVTGTGDIGDFTVTAKPFPQKPFSAGAFWNGRIKEIVLRLITV